MKKLILTDCDGVLLDWVSGFVKYMKDIGFEKTGSNVNAYHFEEEYGLTRDGLKYWIDKFNHSVAMGDLAPMSDSVEYVKKLSELGFKFHVITSLTNDPNAVYLRKLNLENVFGNVFSRLTCLPIGDAKDEALAEYKDSGLYWIEDKPENADVGLEYGLRSILLDQTYNQEYNGGALRAKNWKEIYEEITTE